MNAKNLTALVAGLVFALGLVLSGMTQPAKVVGFLNVMGLQNGISWTAQPGYWDPSLALVMGGALAVTLIGFALTPRRKNAKPWFDQVFHLPTKKEIDRKLVLGGGVLHSALGGVEEGHSESSDGGGGWECGFLESERGLRSYAFEGLELLDRFVESF